MLLINLRGGTARRVLTLSKRYLPPFSSVVALLTSRQLGLGFLHLGWRIPRLNHPLSAPFRCWGGLLWLPRRRPSLLPLGGALLESILLLMLAASLSRLMLDLVDERDNSLVAMPLLGSRRQQWLLLGLLLLLLTMTPLVSTLLLTLLSFGELQLRSNLLSLSRWGGWL